ncbi:MAG: hypothetical protein AB1403_15015 [Candidatus Riflebacteria bacterium]
MKKISLRLWSTLFLFVLVCSISFASAEQIARETVSREIEAALAGKSEFARKVGRHTDFYRDLLKVLRRFPEPGQPKPLVFNGRTVKILVPLNLDENRVGGFFQLSADGRKLLSYLVWNAKFEPLFIVDRQKWEKTAGAEQLPELKELVPLSDGHSAGVPVDPSDLTDLFIIDFVDQLPSKTQEEREEYTSRNGLKASLGRRTGSSKCLSYAASLASDWWNIALGNRVGSYDSFVNGAHEYGMNPRVVESAYFSQPKCPYAFVKETGLDRVTGEKIPYSPKHYAYVMSTNKLPATVNDPLKSGVSYKLPANGFGMDLPYDNSFNKSNGKIEKIREDLQKYGIMYAQHTSRLFSDKVSLTLQGVHAVNIVGTAKLKGEPVVIYYETFGKNHRDYIEDSFYGPCLRAFPVKFFYQGIIFPHRIVADVRIEKDNAVISFKTTAGRKITPDRLQIMVDGRELKIKPASQIRVAIDPQKAQLSLKFARKYFYTPEEPKGYQREYLIRNRQVIELHHYEKVLLAIAERKNGFIGSILGKSDSYTDFLKAEAGRIFARLKNQLGTIKSDSVFLQMVAAKVSQNKVLAQSDLGKILKEMAKFQNLNH